MPRRRQQQKERQGSAQKKDEWKEAHAHVRALFKEMTEEDRDEFLKGAKEAGF
jgi:hypothetical protein